MDHLDETSKRNTLDDFASARKAACSLRVTADHIGRLCRAGVLECRKFGGAWYVSRVSIQRRARGPDRGPANRPSRRECRTVRTRDVPPSGRSGQGGYIAVPFLILGAVLLSANAVVLWNADRIAARLLPASHLSTEAGVSPAPVAAGQTAAAASIDELHGVEGFGAPARQSFNGGGSENDRPAVLALAHTENGAASVDPPPIAPSQPVIFERAIEREA